MADRSTDYPDDPLDRLAARSLAVEERSSKPAPAHRSLFPWVLTTAAIAFALGMVANPWFESSVRSSLPVQLQDEADKRELVGLDALEQRVATLERKTATAAPLLTAPESGGSAELVARVAKLESAANGLASADTTVAARIDRLSGELAASTGADAADRAALKELFLLAAARRSVEVGRSFGPIEGALTAAFAPRDRSATEALVAWSSAPQTLKSLRARLDAPAAEPAAVPAAEGNWWDRLLARMAGVVQVRQTDSLGADPEIRDRATALLDVGELGRAIAALELSPQSPARDLWLADAARLLAAEQALERLETLLLAGTAAVSSVQAASPNPPVDAPPAAGARSSPEPAAGT